MPVNFDLADEESDSPDDFTPAARTSFEPASAPSYAGVDYALAQRKPKRLPKFDTPDFDPRRAAEEYLAPDASEEHAKAQFYAERGFDPVVDAVGRVVPRGTKFGSDGRADLTHLGELDAGVNETPTVRAQMRLQQLQARNDAIASREQKRQDAINERLRQQTADAPRVMAERAHAEAGHANAEEAKHRIALAQFDKSPDGKELKSLVADNPDDASYLNQTAPGGGAAFGDTTEPRTPVEVPIEVQDRMARVDALRQTRDRLAKAHQEAAGKATAAQMRAQSLADERDGVVRQPEPAPPDLEASTRPDVALISKPETDDNGLPTPDSLVRMKNKAGELQATLDGAAGNLATPVRARLKAQIQGLNFAFDTGLAAHDDETQKRVTDATRQPTMMDAASGAVKSLADSAAQGGAAVLKGAQLVSDALPAPARDEFGVRDPQAAAENTRRATLTPSQKLDETLSSPAYQLGSLISDSASEFYAKSKHEDAGTISKGINAAAEAAGGFAPLLASGPLAPVTMGLQTAGNDVENIYRKMVARGTTPDGAADFAVKRALASGAVQAAIFEFIPKPLQGAVSKGIADRIAKGALTKFLTNRLAQGAEGAVLGAGSKLASNATTGEPLTEGVTESAAGLALAQGVMPRGALPVKAEGEVPPATETPPEAPNEPTAPIEPTPPTVPLAPMPPAIDKPARITEMLAAGHTPAEVAAEVGVPLADVHAVRDARGIPSADDPAALEAWKLANEDLASRNEPNAVRVEENDQGAGKAVGETVLGENPENQPAQAVEGGAPIRQANQPNDLQVASPPSPLAVADITPNEVSAEETAAPIKENQAPEYQGTHRPNSEGPRAFNLLEGGLAPRDVYENPSFYTGQPGTKGHSQTVLALKRIRGKPDAEVTIYRASPRNELNSGDWVTLSKDYAAQHGMADESANDVPVHSFKVKASELRWPGDELGEFGYYPETKPIEPVAIGDRGTPEAQAARNTAIPAEQQRLVDEHLASEKQPTTEGQPNASSVQEPVRLPSDTSPGATAQVAEGNAGEVPQPTEASQPQAEEAGADVRPVASEGTGIKNASIAEMREEMGLPPSAKRVGIKEEEAHAQAMAIIKADDRAAIKLAEDLERTGRPASAVEDLVLAQALAKIRKDRARAESDKDAAIESEDPLAIAAAEAHVQEIRDIFEKVGGASDNTGTKQSDAFRMRQSMLKEDFSLANLERQAQRSKGKTPLTAEELSGIKAKHAEFEELQKKYDELSAHKAQSDAERDANNALLKFANDAARERNAPPKARRSVLDSLIERGDAARDRLISKMRSGQVRSSIVGGLEDAPEYAQVVAGYIAKGIRTASDLTARLLKDFGENIRPHIPQILKLGTDEHARSVAALSATGRDTVIEREKTVAALKNRIGAGEQLSSLGGLVKEVIDQHLAEGVKFRDGITDAVHKTLQEVDPSISRSDTLAAISDAQRTDRAIRSLDSQINQLNAQLRTETVFGAGKPRPIHSTEVDAKRAELGALKEQREYLRQRLNPRDFESEAKQKDLARIEKATTALKEKLAREDYSKRPKPPERELDKQVLEAKTRLEIQKEKLLAGQRALELANRTKLQKFGDGVKEALNLPRSVLSSWDLSAVLRQGGFISIANPVRAAKSIAPMLRSLRNDFNAKKVETEIRGRENAPLYKKSGLYLAPLEGAPLAAQEEQIMSKLARNIPGVRASNRAFVTYLNKLRADSFDQMKDGLIASGKEPTKDELEAISNYINVATGRGALGVKTAAAAETLASIFFSPRLAASRFQLLAGQPLSKGSVRNQAQIAKEYAKFAIGLSAIYGLGALAGGQMENDPRSSDFGKMRFGNTRLDPLAGMSQVIALLAKLATGSKKNAAGKVVPLRDTHQFPALAKDPKTGKAPVVSYGGQNEYDVMAGFARSKLSPVVGAGVDLVTGKDFSGQPITPAQVGANLVTPLPFSGLPDVMREHSAGAAPLEMLNLLGMGLQNYQPPKKKPAKP